MKTDLKHDDSIGTLGNILFRFGMIIMYVIGFTAGLVAIGTVLLFPLTLLALIFDF